MSNILSQNINDVNVTVVREYISNYNVDLAVHRLVTVEKNIPLTKLEPKTALKTMVSPTNEGGLGLESTDNIYKNICRKQLKAEGQQLLQTIFGYKGLNLIRSQMI